MSRLFGVSSDLILALLSVTTVVLLVGLAFRVGRGAILLRLGVRNAPRRLLRSALVCTGLALSTAVLTAALVTGDSMTYNIRAMVYGGIGRVDELIVLFRRLPQRLGPEDMAAIVTGQLIAGSRSYFPESEYERIRQGVAENPLIAAMARAIVEPMVVVNFSSQIAEAHVNVIGLPDDAPPLFGEMSTASGERKQFADLRGDEVYLNVVAAALLEAAPDQSIELIWGPDRSTFRVAGIVNSAGFGSEQPAVFLPLVRLQAIVGQPNKINRILVANAGSTTTSVELTDSVLQALRTILVSDDTAERMHALLHSEIADAEMTRARSQTPSAQRAKLDALQAASREPSVSPTFKSLLGDPEVIGRISFVAYGLRGSGTGGRLNDALRGLTGLTVIDLKRAALDRAEEYGAVLTSVFFVVGLLAIAAALALVFLVFFLLTAERRGELGVSRAIGMQRHHLISTLLFEGLAYDFVAAFIGVAIGVSAGSLAVNFVGDQLSAYGVPIVAHFSPRSLAIAYLSGTLLTFLTVGGAAWQVSRLNIVSAISGSPNQRSASLITLIQAPAAIWRQAVRGRLHGLRALGPSLVSIAWGLAIRGPLVVAAGLFLRAYGLDAREWSLFAVGVSVSVVGLALTSKWALGCFDRPSFSGVARGVLLVCAATLILYWLDGVGLGPFGAWPFAEPPVAWFALRGFAFVLCSVWAACTALPIVIRLLALLFGGFGTLLPAMRLALTYPAVRPWSTGLAMTMFALVVFTMALSAILLNVAVSAYGNPDDALPGYDIRGEPAQGDSGEDIRVKLRSGLVTRESDFSAIGTLYSAPAEVVNLGETTAAWRSATVNVLDREFFEAIPLRLAAWDPLFGTADDAWRSVAQRTDLALFAGKQSDGLAIPSVVWVRDPLGGKPARLRLVGRVDPDAGVPGGLVVPRDAYSPQSTLVRGYFFKVRPGVRVEDVALGLNLSFGDSGLKTRIVGEEARRAFAIRGILTYLLEVFLGLGLIAGLSALGILGTMAVVERQSQIGVLRAIGYRRSLVVFGFVIEGLIIAGLGIAIGIAGGLIISRLMTAMLARNRAEIHYLVPWGDLVLIVAVALVASLLTAALPAYQAGRVKPAEAMRQT